MTLLEHWRNYLRDIHSPDSFVDWSYYFTIAAALGRKVWTSSEISPIYSNMFTILVGPPATGKGQSLKHVKNALNAHLLYPSDANGVSIDEHTNDASAEMVNSMKKMHNPPLLYPLMADCTTFESIVEEMAIAVRTIPYVKTHSDGKTTKEIYAHSSGNIVLLEMSNLLKEKKDQKILKYMLDAYDCQDFRYRTKNSGEDSLKNPCLNFIAGTTPKYIRDCFGMGLMEDGFSSRCFFVYEEAPRSHNYDIPEPDAGQKESWKLYLARLKQLSRLYGGVKLSPDAHAFAKHWYEVEFQAKKHNQNETLDSYYGRMRLHMEKLMMAIHFGDSDEMVIQLPTVVKALEVLRDNETKMHLALEFGAANPISGVAKDVLKYIIANPEGVLQSDIFLKFYDKFPNGKKDFMEIVNVLVNDTKQVVSSTNAKGQILFKVGSSSLVWRTGADPKAVREGQKKSPSEKVGDMLEKFEH